MSLPREPFSWDEDGDRPVPLDGSGFSASEPPEVPVVLTEAEKVVREAQEAIVVPQSPVTPDVSEPQRPSRRVSRRVARGSLVAVTAVGCLLAFAHGWSVGAQASTGDQADSCDVHHCSEEPGR
jgi:hypothetical protein